MTPAEWIVAVFLYAMFGFVVYVCRRVWIDTRSLSRVTEERAVARLSIGIVVWPAYLALLGIAALIKGGRRIGRTFRVAFGPSEGGESDD